jgi:hypothetical protein
MLVLGKLKLESNVLQLAKVPGLAALSCGMSVGPPPQPATINAAAEAEISQVGLCFMWSPRKNVSVA